jgi:hypothetical protein
MKLNTPPTYWRPALLALCLGLANLANAATYTLNLRAEADSPLGMYTIAPDGDLESVLTNYDIRATSDGGTRFWTFCMESQVPFQDNRTYQAEMSSSTDSVIGGRDTLSKGTAYLYEQFALGLLDTHLEDFTYDLSGGIRLQQMIWWLEGEVDGLQDAGMWSLLGSNFGNTALEDYTGSAVKVLNLTKYEGPGGDQLAASFGVFRQDQLVYLGSPQPTSTPEPVPDGGTSLVLLASALGGLGILRRRGKSSSSSASHGQ